MIVVTGAAGFIGSCLISYLNRKGFDNLIAVDAIYKQKHPNILNTKIHSYLDRNQFIPWLENNANSIDFIFHIGARTDTTEMNVQIFEELNVLYSKSLWKIAAQHDIPFLYASSAATYGNGALGYSDDHQLISKLKPLNPYGLSKQYFDEWVLFQKQIPTRWAGFKFFNVFGPNEYHKGRMASVIFHAFHQIQNTGNVRLFKSNDPAIKDGEQKRDFIFIRDLLDVLFFFFENPRSNGIYNLGSGQANTFVDLVNYTFEALEKNASIEFIPMPEDLIKTYQNYTCADMSKLHSISYNTPMLPFKDAIQDYVCNYLVEGYYY